MGSERAERAKTAERDIKIRVVRYSEPKRSFVVIIFSYMHALVAKLVKAPFL